MAFRLKFSEEKNQLLKATRGIGFEDVIKHMKRGDLLADKKHISRDRPNQRVYVVKIEDYAYVIPYVINRENNEIFLKTIYASRKFTKQYIKGDEHDK